MSFLTELIFYNTLSATQNSPQVINHRNKQTYKIYCVFLLCPMVPIVVNKNDFQQHFLKFTGIID